MFEYRLWPLISGFFVSSIKLDGLEDRILLDWESDL